MQHKKYEVLYQIHFHISHNNFSQILRNQRPKTSPFYPRLPAAKLFIFSQSIVVNRTPSAFPIIQLSTLPFSLLRRRRRIYYGDDRVLSSAAFLFDLIGFCEIEEGTTWKILQEAAIRSGTYARNQIDAKKDCNNCPSASSHPVHHEEKFCSLPVVFEGWDTMMKRKRSVGPTSKRGFKSDSNQSVRLKSSSGSTLTFDTQGSRADTDLDDFIHNPSTRIKIKTRRTPRTGSPVVHHPDIRTSNEASDELEQHVSATNSFHIDMINGRSCQSSSDLAKATSSSQRSHKDLSSRRPIALSSLVLEPDEAQNQSSGLATSAFTAKDFSCVINNCVARSGANDSNQECIVRFDKVPGPVRPSEDKEVHWCKEVPADHSQKVRGIVLPSERGKVFASMGGVEKQRRVALESCMSQDEILDEARQQENVPKTTSLENIRPGVKKTRGKSCHSPSLKQSGRRTFSREGRKLQIQDPAEKDDDHQEKLAAASSACKASYRACSSRLWMKMEPVFGPVSTKDKCFLKQQLSSGEKLENSLSQEFFMYEETAKGEMLREGSYPVFNEVDKVAPRMGTRNSFGKVSSLYERVLSALIEEDDSGGIYNIVEGMSTSIQCPSDDSHCDSCNCADVETRDGDRFESEAESMFGVQMQKHSHGDKSSCNRSISSITTRNSSVSDSLYSSGRCQADDGLSHSDEFVSAVFQNDQSGSLAANVSTGGSPISDSQYQLMSIDERLVQELQSIGLLLDLPDLADEEEEEEELIDQDIRENLEELYQRIVKKKMILAEIAKSIQDDRERDKRDIEQVAVDKLVEMAYKGRMVCRADQGSRRVIRRVSKQFAMGFMKRTVARCQTFELTGQSCFRQPSLQKHLRGNRLLPLGQALRTLARKLLNMEPAVEHQEQIIETKLCNNDPKTKPTIQSIYSEAQYNDDSKAAQQQSRPKIHSSSFPKAATFNDVAFCRHSHQRTQQQLLKTRDVFNNSQPQGVKTAIQKQFKFRSQKINRGLIQVCLHPR
ncbi:hypothetical protein AKJ16_DCAP18940 [Drosera capensis]